MKHLIFAALVAGLPRELAAIAAGSGPGLNAQQSHSDFSQEQTNVAEWKEVCYVDLYAAAATSTLKYTREVLSKDASGRDVFISDGYKKDSNGKDFYYLETCYRSSSTQGSTRTSKDSASGATELNPFVSIVDALEVGGTSGDLLSGLASGSPLVFGNDGNALLKRQNGSSNGQDDSALDDLNRVSQAIGGPDNVLDLNDSSSSARPGSEASGSDPMGHTGGGGSPSLGGAGDVSDSGAGLDGALDGLDEFGANPFARPSPTASPQGPRVLRLSTVDVQTSILHSDSRQTPTVAQPDSPLFTSASSAFIPGTPSFGDETVTTPFSASGTSMVTTSASAPLTAGIITTTTPTSSLFISVGGGGGQVTGSVTTVATPTSSARTA